MSLIYAMLVCYEAFQGQIQQAAGLLLGLYLSGRQHDYEAASALLQVSSSLTLQFLLFSSE